MTAGKPNGQQVPWPADRIQRRPVASLKASGRNARLHSQQQVDQIAASIKEWGFTMPVLVDEKDEVIAGHGRLMAAHKLGLPEVPVMVAVGWTPAQVRAYRLADNQLALNSAWDVPLLAAELKAISGLEALVGFSADQLLEFLKPPEGPPEEFPSSDENIETEHECPRCQFRWSGSTRPKEGGEQP